MGEQSVATSVEKCIQPHGRVRSVVASGAAGTPDERNTHSESCVRVRIALPSPVHAPQQLPNSLVKGGLGAQPRGEVSNPAFSQVQATAQEYDTCFSKSGNGTAALGW